MVAMKKLLYIKSMEYVCSNIYMLPISLFTIIPTMNIYVMCSISVQLIIFCHSSNTYNFSLFIYFVYFWIFSFIQNNPNIFDC